MLTDLRHGELVGQTCCYLTTVGRASGLTQTVKLWFAAYRDTVYLISGSGERAEWVRNLERTPEVELRIGRVIRSGRARVITDPEEDARARRMVRCKYFPQAAGVHNKGSLAIAVDVG